MVGAWEGSSIRRDTNGRLAGRYPESKQRPRLFLNQRNAFLSAIDCRNSLGLRENQIRRQLPVTSAVPQLCPAEVFER
jgi:hypothetical protein